MINKAEWTDEKEKKVLWKYRFTLTVRIIRVIFIILFLFWLYMFIVSISFNESSKPEKLNFISQLAIDWTLPGINANSSPYRSSNITPFLTQEMSLPLLRTIGEDSVLIGEMNIRKRIIPTFTYKEVIFKNPSMDNYYRFSLPEDPETGKPLNGNTANLQSTWNQLDKIHEGTVGQLSFSTTKYFSPEELVGLLEPYDLHVLWMPVYMGEIKNFNEGWSRTDDSLWVFPWGLTGARERDEHYRQTFQIIRLDSRQDIKISEENMMKNMKELLDENNDFIRTLFGTKHLKERIDYLETNGFQVYGAVVTGPVKELLKLKEIKDIKEAEVGGLTYWNWR